MNEKLQQSTAFGPFPREFVMLAPITCRTSQYEVTDVIGGNVRTSNTPQGKRMINVGFAPFFLFVGVVATSLFPGFLLVELFFRINFLFRHFFRASPMDL